MRKFICWFWFNGHHFRVDDAEHTWGCERYKALGNSWAVPKFRWLGERIARLMLSR